jgi:hypothetical protein
LFLKNSNNIKTVDVAKRTAVGDQIVAAADFIKRGDFIAAEEAIRRGFEIERRGSCGSCPPDPTQFVFFGSYKE